MRFGFPLFDLLLHYRYTWKFVLTVNLSKQHALPIIYPHTSINTIFDLTKRYQETMKAYSKGRIGINSIKELAINYVDQDFHDQKKETLGSIAQLSYDPRVHRDDKLSQIPRAAIGMLERKLYLGHPLLMDVDEPTLIAKQDSFIYELEESAMGVASFLVASVEASARALTNDNKLTPEFIPSPIEVSEIVARLINLDLSWINDIVRKKEFYLKSSRDQKELSLRYMFLDLSSLFFHLSLIVSQDRFNLAQEGLEGFALELRDNCNNLNSEEFYKYYDRFREDLREITLVLKYYNSAHRKKSGSIAQ